MPATNVPVNTITRAAIAPVTEQVGDTANGMTCSNNGQTWLEVSNSAGSPGTVTVAYANTVDGQTIPVKSYSIPATTGKRRIGPFPVALFGTNLVITVSATTITIAAYVLDAA